MELREQLLTKLRSLNVTTVNCDYSGYGDSGQLESVTTTPEIKLSDFFDDYEIPWRKGELQKRSIKEALDDLFWGIIDANYGGFENNEGGGGDLSWDIATDKITLEHYWYIQETDHAPTLTL